MPGEKRELGGRRFWTRVFSRRAGSVVFSAGRYDAGPENFGAAIQVLHKRREEQAIKINCFLVAMRPVPGPRRIAIKTAVPPKRNS